MVLLSRPVSSGTPQDVYDVLQEAYGSGSFDADEACKVVAETLSISESAARSAINSLANMGCAAA